MTNKEYSIPHHGLSDQEKLAADKELRDLRVKSGHEISEKRKIYAGLISLKFRLIDYINSGVFDKDFLFSEILKEYVALLNTTQRKLSQDLGVNETKISKLANDREDPGLGIFYRIEEHSGGVLTASLLWELVSRKLNEEIRSNVTERDKQSKMVSNKLELKKPV